MPDDGNGRKGTDASDVLIEFGKVLVAMAGKWYFWATIALIVIIRSGWASPDNVADLIERTISAWKCMP
jgi:hypothetical protein